jgi:hypothetical protein
MKLEVSNCVLIAAEDYDDLFETLVESLHNVSLWDWRNVRKAIEPDLLTEGVTADDIATAVKMAACHFMDQAEYGAWDVIDYIGNQLFETA